MENAKIEYKECLKAPYLNNPSPSKLIISLVSIIILNIALQFFFGENITIYTIIGHVVALFTLALLILDLKYTKLIISPHGIEYHRYGYKIFAEWKDIKKIELRLRRRFEYVLILKKSKLEANQINQFLLKRRNADVIIPLNLFRHNWHKTSLGKLIKQYAPQVKLPQ